MPRPQFSLKTLLWLLAVAAVASWVVSLMPSDLRLWALVSLALVVAWSAMIACIGLLIGVVCLAVFCFNRCRRFVTMRLGRASFSGTATTH